MARICPACGVENPDASKFCSECGAALADQTIPARKERKFATALFCDVVGSTTFAEREDPEVVQAVVGRAFNRLSEEVERYGGLLEKFMGDALLAVFGVPTVHEDDPERAVRCALEMQAVLAELNRAFAAESKPQIAMRIGIEAGEVLVDLERASASRDRMLTGDAVNVAARIQGAADPNAVLVGPAAHAMTKNLIDYRELAPLELKGKAELVPVWAALRVKGRVGGERAPLGLEADLIGRDEEMTLLKQTLHRVESEGRPALVTVLGPAGVGKSRLSRELLAYIETLPQGVYWRQGRCPPYGGVPYSALTDAIKSQCEVLDDDSADVVTDKIARAVAELFGDQEIADEIGALVGTGAEHRFAREHLFDAWRRFLERMAARYPLILVLEDIHWADDGLLDFIDHLSDWAQGSILVVALARPDLLDRRPGWGGGKRNYSAIYLDPLTPRENEEMIGSLLGTSLPLEVKERIVTHSEGNPLFTEEIVRMFVDQGILRKSNGEWSVTQAVEGIEVPRTIHALIAARLDGLPSEEKSILQDAAVVGRVFWSGAAARLADRSRQEAHDLFGRLRLKDVVVLREPPAFSGEIELAFRHALIRDVAYDSLPKSLRASKHAEVARWAEGRAGDRRDEFAELIATHLTEALSYLDELGDAAGDRREIERQACRWARSAGERAARLWQMPDAVRWYQTALDLAAEAGIADQERALLWSAYARACRGIRPFEEVESAYRQALDLFLSLGNEELAGRTEADLAQIAFQLGHDADVIPRVESALRRLEPLGDSRHLAQALNTLGWYHWRRGRSAEAEPFLRRAIQVADRVGARVVMGDALQTLGILLSTTGRWREGLPMVEESYALGKETQNLDLFLRACNNLPSILLTYDPDYQRVSSLLQEGLQLARKAATPDRQAWILGTLGFFLTERGDLAEAERCMAEALEIAESIAERPLIGMRANELAWVKLLRDDIEAGATLQARADHILQENPERQNEGGRVVVGALAAAAQGDPERELAILVDGASRLAPEDRYEQGSDAMLLEAIRGLCKAGRAGEARPFAEALRDPAEDRVTAAARLAWAEGLLAGDDSGAADLLRDALVRLEALGYRIDAARCLTDLAEVERRAGKDVRAELERARKIFEDCGAKLFLRDLDELPSG